MSSNLNIKQNDALELFNEGATFIFMNVPRATEFGIDYESWEVGAKFKGVKMIPPGLHFVYYSSVDRKSFQKSPRTGFMYNFERREVMVKFWDEETEDIRTEDVSMETIEKFTQNKKDMDKFLGPYPIDSYKKWVSLTRYISENIWNKLGPLDGKVYSATPMQTVPNSADCLNKKKEPSSSSIGSEKKQEVDNMIQGEEKMDQIQPEIIYSDDNNFVRDRSEKMDMENFQNKDENNLHKLDDTVADKTDVVSNIKLLDTNHSPVLYKVQDGINLKNSDNSINSDSFNETDKFEDMNNRDIKYMPKTECFNGKEKQESILHSKKLNNLKNTANLNNLDILKNTANSNNLDNLKSIDINNFNLPNMKALAGTELRFTPINYKSFPENVTPSEITKYSMDYSYALRSAFGDLNKDANINDLLGELQLAFICFVVGQVYESFEAWKKLVNLLCCCVEAIENHPELYRKFISTLHFQLYEIPQDFFLDIVSGKNFLSDCLGSFFENIDIANNCPNDLKKKARAFKKSLEKKFVWSFDKREDLDEEYAPTVVYL